MKRIVFFLVIFTVWALTTRVSAKWSDVGSLAKFQFHGMNTTELKFAISIVNENVTYNKVKDLLVKFNPNQRTKILIHGWMNSDKDTFAMDLVESYVSNFNYNVITVDWCTESFDFYPLSVKAVSKIGRVVAKLVDILVNDYNTSLADIHIIGHSLGAHVSGIAGLNAQVGKVGRITGLDPAFPLFTLKTKERLRTESAVFVDVIHTCSNILSFSDRLGHVDFYPNSGIAIQPGCGLKDLLEGGGCSHSRSFQFFAESIRSPQNFVAKQCASEFFSSFNLCENNAKAYMGEAVSTSARGSYFLTTNKKSPFGKGK